MIVLIHSHESYFLGCLHPIFIYRIHDNGVISTGFCGAFQLLYVKTNNRTFIDQFECVHHLCHVMDR